MRYRIRTLLILMAVASIVLAWIGQSLRWIQQRNDWRDNPAYVGFSCMSEYPGSDDPPTAPGGLWVFGEEGVGTIWCSPVQLESVRRIFPEADIEVLPLHYPPPTEVRGPTMRSARRMTFWGWCRSWLPW
jgi:hypothetical protein